MRQGDQGEGPYSGQPLSPTPILRDTVVVPNNSHLVVRFVANNPGVWFLHCHIDWHLVGGLGIAISYGV
jgi:iron transport multicopper oxidase